MFHIMPNVYEADLQKAKAEAEVAEIEYKNTQLLADGNVVSANELAMAKAEFDKAKAEVKLAETHLGFTNIKAPFDGIMDHLEAREGSLLDEGELLTTLSDNSKMWVYFNVPEAEYLDYITSANNGSKQPVELLMANNRKFDQIGVVETIEGEFNHETGNIAFRATFDNPKGILRHGETGSILMTVPLTHALLIPQKATFEVLDKKYVFVLDDEGKVHQREIHVGAELQHLFVVEKGLSKEDKVLLEGIRMVKNGEKETEPLKTKAAAEMESSSDSTAEIQLVQITEKITSLVTDEIMKALEPLVRNKVNLALQMYENELLQLPNDGGDTEAGIN